ncbi:MAG TPA: DNA-binding response regulator [Firmicutes bacterium]|nr:DNA-binding response regulator [Bacillota bacterium]
MNKKILLVEDDVSISEMVSDYLLKEGFDIVNASDGSEAIETFKKDSFDLILLDLMIPKINGMDVIKAIREISFVPILIISAKNSDVDKALGLGFGADDYLTKPFSLIELLARVSSAIRRTNEYSPTHVPAKSKTIKINELELDLDNYCVKNKGSEVKLTSKEFQILKLLMNHPKKVFSKEQIYRAVWDEDYFGEENAINVHISRLRDKIEDDPCNPKYIKTIWGIGYKLGDF